MNSIKKEYIVSKLDSDFRLLERCKNEVKQNMNTDDEQGCVNSWWRKHDLLHGYLEGIFDALREYPETREFLAPYRERLEDAYQDFIDVIQV